MAQRKTPHLKDPGGIANLAYNDQSGAEKNVSVGPHLKPLKATATTYTTDASTARAIEKGSNLAIYNNAGAVGAITLGASAAEVATALAAGVTGAAGQVGIPCPPNQWTYISAFDKTFIKATANTLLVFLIVDDSNVK